MTRARVSIRALAVEAEGDAGVVADVVRDLVGDLLLPHQHEAARWFAARCRQHGKGAVLDAIAADAERAGVRVIRSAPFAEAPAPSHGSAGSVAAAAAIAPRAGTLRARVLDHVRACGARGATRAEVVAALGLKENTVNGRCAELVAAGLLVERGARGGRAVLVDAHRHPSESP